MKTFIEIQHTAMIKKFHTLMRAAGMSGDDKANILHSYGVNSTKELSLEELTELCDKVYTMANPKLAELDKLRKRLMASIGAYLREMDYDQSSDSIKRIACRAAGVKEFNKIPAEKLRALYGAFNYYKKAMVSVGEITSDILIHK